MPLISETEYNPETFLVDVALQRTTRNQLIMQLKSLGDGLLLNKNPLIRLRSQKRIHICAQFDTLPQVATRYFGSPDRWPDIAEANRLEYPYTLLPGQNLEIPSLDANG